MVKTKLFLNKKRIFIFKANSIELIKCYTVYKLFHYILYYPVGTRCQIRIVFIINMTFLERMSLRKLTSN